MPGDAPEVRRVEIPSPTAPGGHLRVALLPGEPPGRIPTRAAGCVELEATLEWPPGWTGGLSVLDLLPVPDGEMVRLSLDEAAGTGRTTVRGELRGPDEEALSVALDGVLRAVSSAAAVREAALRTRVLRVGLAWCPDAEAVQSLARHLWGSGFRVGFGASWSPAVPGADVMLGCRGAREKLAAALPETARVDRAGTPG